MKTVLNDFYNNVLKYGPSACFKVKDQVRDKWLDISWEELLSKVVALCNGLNSLGVKKGDNIAIFANTRYEWTLIDLACLSIGAVSVPIYHTLGEDHLSHILNHSNAKIIFVEDEDLLGKFNNVKDSLSADIEVVLIQDDSGISSYKRLDDLLIDSEECDREWYKRLISKIDKDDVATCVYTSGTTGNPKGVEHTHSSLLGEVRALQDVFFFADKEVGLLFLPLAHVIARAMQFFQLSEGCVTAYAESVAKVPQNIIEVRPEFMVVVPRVMEKIYEKIMNEIGRASPFKRSLFNWSVHTGKELSKESRKHKSLSLIQRIKSWFVKRVVFAPLHRSMGGRLKMIMSGGAPLDKALADFFHAAGLLILEGYGLTETFAAITVNRPDDFKFGTVGKPLCGVEMKIAEDGEVLVKGPQVFRGYRLPLDNIDEEPFENGWFRTGDIGSLSRDGFLRLTDRKKELIVTAAGKNIAPQRVESVVKSSKYISDVVVYGDRRKYLSALITIEPGRLMEVAEENSIQYSSIDDLIQKPLIKELINSEIECRNKLLARHETIKKFKIVGHAFTQESGELTPTLKLRRRKIYEKYKDLIESMY